MSTSSFGLAARTSTGEAVAHALRRRAELDERSPSLLVDLDLVGLAAPAMHGGLDLPCVELFDVIRVVAAYDFAQSRVLVEQSALDLAFRWQALGELSKRRDTGATSTMAMTFGLAAACLGAAQTGLEGALAYASARRQFARRIVEHGAVQALLGQIGLDVLVASVICDAIARRGEPDVASFPMLPALALRRAGSALWSACDHGMQVAGGIGYFEEHFVRLVDGRKAATASLFRQTIRLLPRLRELADSCSALASDGGDGSPGDGALCVETVFEEHAAAIDAEPRLAALRDRWHRDRHLCSGDAASRILQALWLGVAFVSDPSEVLHAAFAFTLRETKTPVGDDHRGFRAAIARPQP